MHRCFLLAACAVVSIAVLHAQTDSTAHYEVVSIKRNTSGEGGMNMTSTRDGTIRMTNISIRSLLSSGAPVPVRDVVGYPDWVTKDRYDIIAKPPEGIDRTRQGELRRNLLIDYMKLQAHVEQQERNTFALVLARKDGKLGPALLPTANDCSARVGTGRSLCGTRGWPGRLEGGAMTLDFVASSLTGPAGGLVNNRTGLDGFYDMTLKYSSGPREPGAPPDDAPDVFTAVQEQLGLKLVPEKSMVPVFVVDHIERPIEN